MTRGPGELTQPKKYLRGPGQCALRHGRRSEPGRTYHVTTTTRRRKPVFRVLRCARVVVHELRISDRLGYTNTLAYVIMPDHLHWLFELRDTCSLDRVVNQIKGRSSRAIGRFRREEGGVWQPGFFDHALREEEDAHTVSRYIVANPLRAGLVKEIGAYSHWDAVWLTEPP